MAYNDGPDTYQVGDVGVPAAVAPLGTFPSYRSSCGIGTPKLVDTIVARDAIPANYRAEGMISFVTATGLNYQLVGGILNANWVTLPLTTPPLDAVLAVGNETLGTDIELTPGDEVRGDDAAAGGAASFRGGDGSAGAGGAGAFRGGDGTTVGGTGTFRAGDASAGPGGVGTFRSGDGLTGAAATFRAGDGSAGAGGAYTARAGNSAVGVGAPASLNGGGGGGAANGGPASVTAGPGGPTGEGALASLLGGPGGVVSGDGGGTLVRSGPTNDGDGGDSDYETEDGAGAAGNGGTMTFRTGAGSGAGVNGPMVFRPGGSTAWQIQADGELAGEPGIKLDADGAVGLGSNVSITVAASPYAVPASAATILVDASGGPVTVNLPLLAAQLRREVRVKKTDASVNSVTIDGAGAETIDGALTKVLASQYDSAVLIAGAAEWNVFGTAAAPASVATGVANDFTNANAGAITQGQAVYVTTGGARRVDLADATADAPAARVIGFVVPASIASAALGSIGTDGLQVARLVGALALTLGDEVFLSLTAGSCTNVAPSASGNVVKTVGYLTDTLTYNGVGDLLVQIQVERGPKAVV